MLQESVSLIDKFSGPMLSMVNSIQAVLNTFGQLDSALSSGIDSTFTDTLRTSIEQSQQACAGLARAFHDIEAQAGQAADKTGQAMRRTQSEIAAAWRSGRTIDIFDGGGMERFRNEIEGVNRMMTALRLNQDAITQNAVYGNVLPPNAGEDMIRVNEQMERIAERINQISSAPAELVSGRELSELQSLREQMNGALLLQRQIDDAVGAMDVEGANRAYLQLQQIMQRTDISTRDMTNNIREMTELINNAQPPQWQSPSNIEIFQTSGIERYRQELSGANNLINQLAAAQERITQNAIYGNVLPPNAANDMIRMGERINAIQQRIARISANPMDVVSASESRQLEQLREQLNNALQLQNEMNDAVQRMDVSAANEAYRRLSQILGGTERQIRDNIGAQEGFNNSIREGSSGADELLSLVKSAVGTYAGIRGMGKVLNISDTLTSVTARLGNMNDAFNTANNTALQTYDIINMVYGSAQRARGSFSEMAAVVAKFGNNASEAFGSQAEVVAFAELIQKQMIISGAGASEASNAMLQLSQALGSGVLRGDELNSIFEQAPNLIRTIAEYMGVSVGQIRSLASEGKITADIIKNAMFASADDINAQFENMPQTFSQIWTSFKNNALVAFQPVLQRLNVLANNEKFQAFVNGAVDILSTLAGVAMGIMEAAANVASFIADNWEVMGTILGIVAIAVVSLTVASAAYNAVQLVLNSTLWACPIVWIIAAVIAAALAFVMFTEQIVGAVYWVGALGKNVGLWCANVGIAIWNTIKNIGQWFVNLGGSIWAIIQNVGAGIANFFMGIVEVVKTIVGNIGAAFNNAWIFVQQTFWVLVDSIMQGLKGIADFANNTLGWIGVNIDTSDFDFAKDKIKELNEQYQEFGDVGEAWDKGMSTFGYQDVNAVWDENPIDWASGWNEGMNTFQYDDLGAAYNEGAKVGAGIHDSIMGVFDLIPGMGGENDPYAGDVFGNDETQRTLNEIAANTGNTADALDISSEDLKYMRDIAERDTINRFTTAEIKVEWNNTQNISSDMDVDGVMNYFATELQTVLETTAEGVHS